MTIITKPNPSLLLTTTRKFTSLLLLLLLTFYRTIVRETIQTIERQQKEIKKYIPEGMPGTSPDTQTKT